MNIFEPAFLVLALVALVAMTTAVITAIRGHWARATCIELRVVAGAALYFTVVAAVALATPPKTYHIGDAQCFDDWCITVASAQRTAASGVVSYAATLRLSSRAKRVAQSERSGVVYLIDARGRQFTPVADPLATALDVRLQPGESATTARTFNLPADATDVALVFAHTGFPIGDFIIGENRWFHGLPVVRLDQ